MEENNERGRFIKAETIDKQAIGKNYLLLIGINSYEHIKKLNYAVSDTLAVKDLLTKRYQFEESSATILLNEQASRNEIIQTFWSLVGKLEANDSLLIYYAGHGHYDDRFDMGYWIPVEGKQDEIGTYIPNSDLINAISRIKAKHIFLVSDSCFSGTLLATDMRDSFTDRAKSFPSRWGLCSGRKELVLDKSYFAQSFISFLQENQEKELLVRHLIDYVEKNTANNTEQTPLGSRLRNVGDGGGEFVFHLKANESEREQTDFEKLKNAIAVENKNLNQVLQLIQEIKNFLKTYKQSNHRGDAIAFGKEAEDEKEWLEACKSGKEFDFIAYLDNDRNVKFRKQAEEKIEEFEKKTSKISAQELKKEPIVEIKLPVIQKQEKNLKEKLLELIDSADISSLFELLDKEKISNPVLSQLRNEFISGKYFFDFYDRLEVFVNSLDFKETASNHQNLTIPLTDKINLEMVYVEGGTFEMGYKEGRDGKDEYMGSAKPLHQVSLDSFYIGKFQITQEQYFAISGENPSNYKGDKRPVETISWTETQEFIKKLNEKTGKNFRLPIEAEWEYAARGGNQSKGFMYAGSNNIDEVAWYSENSGSETHEVGLKKPNELGIYDMSGNVWEWCEDYWDEKFYEKSAGAKNPMNNIGSTRVRRGGSWVSYAVYSRVANRDNGYPSASTYRLGFRLVCL